MTVPTDPRDDQARIPQQTTTAPTEPAAEPTSPTRRPARRWPWIVAAALAVLVVAGGITYAFMPSNEDKAVEHCQAAISDQLKAPSTAKYSADATVTSENGNFGTYYEVSGAVDAENGFGALVRGDYRCKLTRESDGGWMVTESSFNQR